MEAAARKQISQENNEIELVRVQATKLIAICDDILTPNPTVIMPGEVFWVNLIPMDGLKGLGAHFQGESFFVEAHEWTLLSN